MTGVGKGFSSAGKLRTAGLPCGALWSWVYQRSFGCVNHDVRNRGAGPGAFPRHPHLHGPFGALPHYPLAGLPLPCPYLHWLTLA